MNLKMAGTDFHKAPLEIREKFSFSKNRARQILNEIYQYEGVKGCVLLLTCNRTELYFSLEDNSDMDIYEIFIKHTVSSNQNMKKYIYEKAGDNAVNYIIEVACGLHSQVLHEEQIVTQVNQAITFSDNQHTADAVLDTLFRMAVSAGKYSHTEISLPAVPLSVSHKAVEKLEHECGKLAGKRCIVIGNGKMGRLTAELLQKKECKVYVTLRNCHKCETIIPYNTEPVLYDSRFEIIDGADIVISATRSPHYTITASQLEKLSVKPLYILDLAMPRDIEPECGNFEGVCLWNLDDFENDDHSESELLQKLYEITKKYADDFRMWSNYREALPYIENLKETTAERIYRSKDMDIYRNTENFKEIVKLTAEKTADMIMGGIKSEITPELLKNCCEKISGRLRAE